jgi:hypothetical protein
MPNSLLTSALPRILLLSDEGPHLSSAGGILLFRLLEDYPTERLHVIERHVEPGRTRLACRDGALATPWRRFEGSRFNRWKRSLRAFGLVPPVALDKIDALLDGFKPDIVLCVMQHAAYYDCAHRFAQVRGLPLVVIVHDVNEQFEPVLPFALGAARRRDGAFYRYASRRLCISPEMEELCAKLYGVRGDVLYPNRSERLHPRPFEESRLLKRPGVLSVGFVGNLNYGYGEELLRLLPVFRDASARLVIFSHPPGRSCAALLDAKDCCEFRGFAPTPMDAWRVIQAECDAVILPYPNSPGVHEELYRHHFPSKLPEYLALGMPTIVTGPEYATGVKWGLRNPGCAVTCRPAEPTTLIEVLGRLRMDGEWRMAVAQAGFNAGIRDFDPARIKSQFVGHICAAAHSGAGVP